MADNSTDEVDAEFGAAEEPGGSPSDAEIVIPPLTLVTLFIAAIIGYSCLCTSWWKMRFKHVVRKDNKIKSCDEKLSILSESDRILLEEVKSFQNNPLALLKLAFPALVSMALCPVALLLYEPTVAFLWPSDQFQTSPDINQAIICFLMPAGMIYAIAFGFFFQDVIGEFMRVSSELAEQRSMFRQIAQLTSTVKGFSSEQKKKIFLALKYQIILWIKSITRLKNQNSTLQEGFLWNVVNSLQQSPRGSVQGILDNQVVIDMTHKILKLDEFMITRVVNGKKRMNILQWLFLEILGFISFFGVLMITAQSYRIELTMCMITVFSISIFCYMLADFDCALHGVFRVDLSPIYKSLLSDVNDLYEKETDATEIKQTLNINKLMKPLSKQLCNSFTLNTKKVASVSYH